MIKNLPSLRYDLFIRLLEKEATALQARYRALESMEHPYNVVKEALEAANLPNEQKLTCSHGDITATITATPTDLASELEKFIASIGKRLREDGLHKSGEPARSDGGSLRALWGYWICSHPRAGSFYVYIHIEVPESGLPDLDVISQERKSITREWNLIRRERPTYTTNIKTVGEREAALDPEVPF